MDKVVILARVSTDKQDYERQVNELTEFCSKASWNVERIFANKGALSMSSTTMAFPFI